jgi:hypothetical protein
MSTVDDEMDGRNGHGLQPTVTGDQPISSSIGPHVFDTGQGLKVVGIDTQGNLTKVMEVHSPANLPVPSLEEVLVGLDHLLPLTGVDVTVTLAVGTSLPNPTRGNVPHIPLGVGAHKAIIKWCSANPPPVFGMTHAAPLGLLVNGNSAVDARSGGIIGEHGDLHRCVTAPVVQTRGAISLPRS